MLSGKCSKTVSCQTLSFLGSRKILLPFFKSFCDASEDGMWAVNLHHSIGFFLDSLKTEKQLLMFSGGI